MVATTALATITIGAMTPAQIEFAKGALLWFCIRFCMSAV
jgi:hypothetical protein